MEERALYRAILAAPHDDALRLAYADWLDEHADALPQPAAERARAEFIRLRCAAARQVPAGWRLPGRGPVLSPRERRLLFHHGKKWRRAFSVREASAPFDRGFLRPYRSFTPGQFLGLSATGSPRWPFQSLPPDSPARRYVPEEDSPFAACPLWDVHLYAPGWLNDLLADQGQYGELLAQVARSPRLRQVGWLKLSFLRTPVLDFLRSGDFSNVETLVLNSGPFPDVLEAVTGNESFRSLRYVQFGSDHWAWAPSAAERMRFYALDSKFGELNGWHMPFGAMRPAILSVLRDTPVPPPPTPAPPPPTFGPATLRETLLTDDGELKSRWAWPLGAVCVAICVLLALGVHAIKVPPAAPRKTYNVEQLKPPPMPLEDPQKQAKQLAEIDAILKSLLVERPDLKWKPLRLPNAGQELPVAPPPREAK